MRPFCEVIVADVLPTLRAIVANELSKTYGLSQMQISKKLGITQPAISQYKRQLRGQKAKLISSNEKIMRSVNKITHDIATKDVGPMDVHKAFCEICKKIREEGLICDIHHGKHPSTGPCKICFE